LFSAVIAALRLASAETRTPAQLSEAFATTLSAHDMDGFAALFADNCVNHQVSAKKPEVFNGLGHVPPA